MALSAADTAAAKADAVEFLEYSLQVLCLSLGMDPADASSSFTNPVASDHPSYNAYLSVIAQATALEALA
jgi:hypothetical protein